MRIFLTVLAALLMAGGSGYYLLRDIASRPVQEAAAAEQAVAPQRVHVYGPSVALGAGTIILPEHLQAIPFELEAVSDEMIVADAEGRTALLGSVARQALPRGVPIARSAVVQPGERGFLAAVLPSGKRAVSIPVSEVAGVSGLVVPGDRVDIILTYSVAGSEIDAGRDIQASETVLTGLRVLALDQRLQEAEPAAANDPNGRPVARTATLEVTPQQAEMLTLAGQLGELSLVLNALGDGEPALLPAVVAGAPARMPTVDSQVTSLLLREMAVRSPEDQILVAPPSLDERVNRVQVVRGIESRAIAIGGDGSLQAAPAGGAAALGGAVRAVSASAGLN